jgi:DNA polymerase-3 subunit epsilon
MNPANSGGARLSGVDPDLPLRDLELTAFDFETTGLSARRDDRPVEIGAVRFKALTGAVTGRFESMVDPARGIPADVVRIHGITDAIVRGAPLWADIAPHFVRFAAGSVGIAHNARFDVSFLQMLHQHDPAMTRGSVLDSKKLASRLAPEQTRRSLSALAERFSIESPRAHRAFADAWVLSRVAWHLLQRLGADAKWRDLLAAHGPSLRCPGFTDPGTEDLTPALPGLA